MKLTKMERSDDRYIKTTKEVLEVCGECFGSMTVRVRACVPCRRITIIERAATNQSEGLKSRVGVA
jgi:hypothetical protein